MRQATIFKFFCSAGILGTALLFSGCGSPAATNTNIVGSTPVTPITTATATPDTGSVGARVPEEYQAKVTVRVESIGSNRPVSLPTMTADVAKSGNDRRMEFMMPAGGRIVYLDKAGTNYLPPSGQASRAAVQVVLSEAAFNEVLNTIFQDLQAPTFPTALGPRSENSFEYAAFAVQTQCPGQIRILNEGSGVRTGVDLSPGRISAPMAFTGSMSTILGCIEFTGWAEARLDLRFEAAEQAVYGVITVETVNLDGVNPLMTGIVTPLVQSTINQRVNPILILRGEQLGLNVPVTSASGRLTARASDIRAEVEEDAVTFSIEYDFEGTSATSQPLA